MNGTLETIINFIGEKPYVPDPEIVNANAATGDSWMLIFSMLFIAFAAVAWLILSKCIKGGTFTASSASYLSKNKGMHTRSLKISSWSYFLIAALIAIITVVCSIVFFIASANASNANENSINAFVDIDTKSITVEDEAILNDQEMAFQVVTSIANTTQSSQQIEGIENLHIKIEALNDAGEVEGLIHDAYVGELYNSDYLQPFIKDTTTNLRYTIDTDEEELISKLIDTQICVSFSYDNGYSIVYDGNGAESGDVPKPQFKSADESITLADKPNLTKERYTLDNEECGWCTVPIKYEEGYTYSFEGLYSNNEDIVLYARWHQTQFQLVAHIDDNSPYRGTINDDVKDVLINDIADGSFYYLDSTTNIMTIKGKEGETVATIEAIYNEEDLAKPHSGSIFWEGLAKDNLMPINRDIVTEVGFYGALYKYTLSDLVTVSNDLAQNGESSEYYKEFSAYVKHAFDRTWDEYGNEVCTGNDNGSVFCDSSKVITNVNADNHWIVDFNSRTFTENRFSTDSGNNFQFRIIGINQDTATDGSQTGLTMMSTHWIGNEMWYHDYNVNFDGWGNSCLRDWSNYQFEQRIPSVLQQSIVPVNKQYGVSANSSETAVSTDSIWTLSLNELTGKGDPIVENPYPYSQEGQQYDAFKDKVKTITTTYGEYEEETTYSVEALKNISKTQDGQSDTEFIWMRSLYDNWRTFDTFDDAALGFSGLENYPGCVFFHDCFSREQQHGLCPCFCLGSVNDFELTTNDVYVSEWFQAYDADDSNSSLIAQNTGCILKTYGDAKFLRCDIPEESSTFIREASFKPIKKGSTFYRLDLTIQDDIPYYGGTVSINVTADVDGQEQTKVINIHFDNWIYSINPGAYTVNVVALQEKYSNIEEEIEIPTAAYIAFSYKGIEFNHLALPVVYVGKGIVGALDTEHNSIFWYPGNSTTAAHFLTNIEGKTIKSKGSAYTGIRFEKYAFATVSSEEDVPANEVASLKGFDFSSLHEPIYGDYLFYGNVRLSEFKFNRDLNNDNTKPGTGLPRFAFGGFKYPNVGLTTVDLSDYVNYKGSIHACFRYCKNIKTLDLSGIDAYYLESDDIEYMDSLETIKIGIKNSEEGKCFVDWARADIFYGLPKLKTIELISEVPLSAVYLPKPGTCIFGKCGDLINNITIYYKGETDLLKNINDYAYKDDDKKCSTIVAINQK